MDEREIGLALSGGGARCFAQIGALRAIEEAGYRVGAIAANSSAAILGALYAAGHDAAALTSILRETDMASFLDADGGTGLIGHDGVRSLLEAHAPATFEELRIPFAVTAVDIERAELLVFRDGPLALPVCASNAFPGLFTPVTYGERSLMDGGMLNNFPVDVIRTLTRRPVVGIDVRPPANVPLDVGADKPDTLVGKVVALFDRGVPLTVKLVMQAYNITQSRLVELTVALHPLDVWLRPDLPPDMGVEDFSRFEETLEEGYRSTADAIAQGRFDDLTFAGA